MKFKLTDETMVWKGVVLHRIQALKDFNSIKKGELGGWVEKEENLSHEGRCWTRHEAKALGNSRVEDSASLCSRASIEDNTKVKDTSVISYNAIVEGDSMIGEGSTITGNAFVYNSTVKGSYVSENAYIKNSAILRSSVYKYARIYDSTIADSEVYLSIDGGTWNKTPLIIQGSNWKCHMITPEILKIGCQEHKLKFWLRRLDKICLVNHVSDIEKEEYREYIEMFNRRYGNV